MKSLTFLLLAGVAVASQKGAAQAGAAQAGAAQAAAGNATNVQQGNSTEVNQGANANATAGQDNNNNNNNQDNNVIQVQNGQQCINVEALNDPKYVSHFSPMITLCYIKLTRYSFHSFDPAQLDLQNMNQGGLNLGSINLADPISLAFGIDQLMNSFCLGGILDLNTLLALGVQQQQQMFLELAQLAQLQQLGLLNVFGAQNLIQSNLLFGGAFNVFNAGRSPQQCVDELSNPTDTLN